MTKFINKLLGNPAIESERAYRKETMWILLWATLIPYALGYSLLAILMIQGYILFCRILGRF